MMFNFFTKKTRISLLPDDWAVIYQINPNERTELNEIYNKIDFWCKNNLEKNKWKWVRRSKKVSDDGSLNPFRPFYMRFHNPTMIDFKNSEDALMVKILFGL